jgi:hypothetical protein
VFPGIGLNTIIAVFFAVHCVRSGRQLYWLLILFVIPIFGPLIYFITEYLPDMRVGARVDRASSVASRVLDPSRELRDARAALDLTPTAQNRMRVANALLAAGKAAEAAAEFEACLSGPFANDPDIAFKAAEANLACQQPSRARMLLEAVRSGHPEFRAEALAIMMAQAFTAEGDTVRAGRELRFAEERYGGVESRAEYAIWAAQNGDMETAKRLRAELDKSWNNWSGATRSLHRPLMRRVEAALGARS